MVGSLYNGFKRNLAWGKRGLKNSPKKNPIQSKKTGPHHYILLNMTLMNTKKTYYKCEKISDSVLSGLGQVSP